MSLGGRTTRGAVGALLALALSGIALSPAGASTQGEKPSVDGRLTRAPYTLPSSGEWASTRDPMIAWPEGSRLFFLSGLEPSGPAGFHSLTAMDSESRRTVGSVALKPPALATNRVQTPLGGSHHLAIDRDGGRVFVAYQQDPPSWGGLATAQESVVDPALAQAQGQTCANPERETCFAGVYVIDAVSLDIVRKVPLRLVSVDGGTPNAQLRAMSYAPPRGPDDSGKVLVLFEEVPATYTGAVAPQNLGANLVYVAQFDPVTGTQDWVYRVDGCRYRREGNEPSVNSYTKTISHGAAVFRTRDLDDPAVVAVCHGSNQSAVLVRIPLLADGTPPRTPVVARPQSEILQAPGDAAPTSPVEVAPGTITTVGPERALQILADPEASRVLIKVNDGQPVSEVWWVFDAVRWHFVGTVGIGQYSPTDNNVAFDIDTGRLYVFGWQRPEDGFAGGIYVADTRRTPLPQALLFPFDFRSGYETSPAAPGIVESTVGDRPTRVYLRGTNRWHVFEDRLPISLDPPDLGYEGRTLDLDEVEGVTRATFDGVARAYGVRGLFAGGLEAVGRAGPVDAGSYYVAEQSGASLVESTANVDVPQVSESCTGVDRDLTLAFVGAPTSAVIDDSGGRASAAAMSFDSSLRADVTAPASRCTDRDWDQLWTAALFGSAPVQEPEVPWLFGDPSVECLSDGTTSERYSDPVMGRFSAGVDCEHSEVNGWSRTHGLDLGGVTVGEVMTSFRVYRDPGRGIVSSVESAVRGLVIDGLARMETLRASGESWANGRRTATVELDEGEQPPDYNCDFDRTAGTCHRRSVFGFWSPSYSCGPCGDEERLVEAINRVLGSQGRVMFRDPDPDLARGSDNGYIAAVTKRETERFADLVLNNDLLQTVVPSMELVRYAPSARPNGSGRRGRQVYQFAGVEVSSSYGIQCLLDYDPERNRCAASAEPPGSLAVSLTDPAGGPLAGAAFELRQDSDHDGVLGLADQLVAEGACVTAGDGTGTCRWPQLPPATYVVQQLTAPAGFAPLSEPYVVQLASGEARSLDITNVSTMATVVVAAQDDVGDAVAGARFELYRDGDGNGVADGGAPAAECITGVDGRCAMTVPMGMYVLRQTATRAGLAVIDPVAFALTAGGQTAAISVVNWPPGGTDGVAPPAPERVVDVREPVAPPVVEHVGGGAAGEGLPRAAPRPEIAEELGQTIERVIRAPGELARLLARSPLEGLAFAAVAALLGAASLAARRRRSMLRLL